ncbi:MAG: CobD/CbiB family protein [Pseudomonadota bacterium]
MSFLSLLAALLLEQARPLPRRNRFFLFFAHYCAELAHRFNTGRYREGVIVWIATVLPLVVMIAVIYFLLDQVSLLLGWAWNVAVLYFTMSLRQFMDSCGELAQALRGGDPGRARQVLARWRGADADSDAIARLGIERGVLVAWRHVFGVMFWFVLLGAGGAVLYRFAAWLAESWGERAETQVFGGFARQAFAFMDWLPARLLALSFAVVGNFEDAVYCWRSQAANWAPLSDGVVLASAAGALGVRIGGDSRPELGTGDVADADDLPGVIGLVWRALVVWLLLVLLLTVASWVGA